MASGSDVGEKNILYDIGLAISVGGWRIGGRGVFVLQSSQKLLVDKASEGEYAAVQTPTTAESVPLSLKCQDLAGGAGILE